MRLISFSKLPMKTKLLTLALLVLFVAIVVTQKNNWVTNKLLSIINPVKQTYTNLTKEVGEKSQSYVYQKENIQRLLKENKYLRKRLLEQKHYIQQVRDLYRKIPTLERIPRDSIGIVQSISYVKLNTFNQIILTKPKDFIGSQKKLYGLIQGSVVGGVAKVIGDNLYGALVSSDQCRFSVFVGESRAAGVAIGISTKQMQVKFIPKWVDVQKGDEVVTSGLDTIFFADIPVGVVEKVEIESSYKVAYIKPYSDILHPDYFYLVIDPSATLTSQYDGIYISDYNNSKYANEDNVTMVDVSQMKEPTISSIPSLLPEEPKNIIQTQDDEVSSEQLQAPVETHQQEIKNRKTLHQQRVENLDIF